MITYTVSVQRMKPMTQRQVARRVNVKKRRCSAKLRQLAKPALFVTGDASEFSAPLETVQEKSLRQLEIGTNVGVVGAASDATGPTRPNFASISRQQRRE